MSSTLNFEELSTTVRPDFTHKEFIIKDARICDYYLII